MSRYEAMLSAFGIFVIVSALAFWGYQGHTCKLEAIKAGMKGDEVVKACR